MLKRLMALEIGLGHHNVLICFSKLESGIVTMPSLKKIKIEATICPQFELEFLKVLISFEVFLIH